MSRFEDLPHGDFDRQRNRDKALADHRARRRDRRRRRLQILRVAAAQFLAGSTLPRKSRGQGMLDAGPDSRVRPNERDTA